MSDDAAFVEAVRALGARSHLCVPLVAREGAEHVFERLRVARMARIGAHGSSRQARSVFALR